MSKRQLSIKEAFIAKRTAMNEASQVMLPPEYSEELLGDSDVDVGGPSRRSLILSQVTLSRNMSVVMNLNRCMLNC